MNEDTLIHAYIIPRFRRREGEADDKNDIVELHPWTVWWQLEESSASSPQSKSGSPDIASSLGVKFRLPLYLSLCLSLAIVPSGY